MDLGKELFFSIFNFCLLVGILCLIAGPVVRQFFYSRRERTRKWIAESAWELRKARLRLKKIKSRMDGLADDVASRRDAIEKDCRRECDEILREAEKRRDRILKNAKRFSAVERKQSIREVREKMILNAFLIAEQNLRMKSPSKLQHRIFERAFDDLEMNIKSGCFSSERGRTA